MTATFDDTDHSRLSALSALDPARVAELCGDAVTVGLEPAGTDGLIRFVLAAAQPVPLRRMLPALESMDLEVLGEQTSSWTRADGQRCHLHDLVLQPGRRAGAGLRAFGPDTDRQIRDTFHAIWAGRAEADGFNTLILAAGLSWRQVCVLRSYSRYLRQLPMPYGQSRIQSVLMGHPEAARATAALFEARFGDTARPARDAQRQALIATAARELATQIDRVVHIDADRILRAYRNLITTTVRTNAYAPEAITASAPYLVHKLRAQNVEELPHPRPYAETFVYSPDFEGLHLRFGPVARGGLRWSDRHDDYRAEVLGLVKAQAVKNAVIVPVGAKGVFVVKPSAAGRRPDDEHRATRSDALRCYRHFVSALLDVVDDVTSGDAAPRAGVVCHDESDPYLVVAADKGTATFSDTANSVALQRGYWLGDAFASGGSAGYDHKAMGITARGAWVSGDMHLAALGIDAHRDAFRVVGIGDMGGDVFGNGMLLRPGIRLIAAFDHRHIFIDPTPAADPALRERRRLFDSPGSSWDDYDRTVISAGGGVWPRTAKTIAVSAQMRAALDITDPAPSLTPNELISHLLRAPVELLFNGGIGTYVKASDEQHTDVADKVNDTLRIDASDVRTRVIVEGGNLGVSPRGRVEFARRGGAINTDAVDNAAGVDCSDHEVNIKILLDAAARRTALPRSARNRLLAEMTDDVAEQVLGNNRAHNRLLSDAQFNAVQMVDVHARMVTALEQRRGLHRRRECLPTAKEFDDLRRSGAGLTRPQLATLMANVKLDLKADLLADDQLDDPQFGEVLHRYFPPRLRRRLGEHLRDHPLRREIIATSVINHVVATSGLTHVFRLAEETGATTSEIVRAHAIVTGVFDLDTLWDDIYASGLAPALTDALVIEGRRLLDRASRWVVQNRPAPLQIGAEIDRFAQPVATLRGKLPAMLRGNELATMSEAREALVARGVPAGVAAAISDSLYAFSLLDVVEMAYVHGEDSTKLAHIYFELSDHLGVDALLLAVSSLPRGDRWHSLARLALRDDLYRSLRALALDVSRRVYPATDDVSVIEEFEAYNRPRLQRARRTLGEFLDTEQPDMAVLAVATAQLRRLTTTHV